MKKIVVVPLDERPCNYNFNQWLAPQTDFKLVLPPLDILGEKKQVGDVEAINEWLINESKDAYGAVIAIDTLLYSGIIPSRLHNDSSDTLNRRLNVLKTIRKTNPKLKIYAYNLIMRNPKYSSSEEEPDYYADYGREIHRHGVITHKKDLEIASSDELKELSHIESVLPSEFQEDYLNRRKINLSLNQEFLNYIHDKTIDFGVIPQDDSSPYGLTAIDQQTIKKSINDLTIDNDVYMYPGADEVTNTLIARMINKVHQKEPKIKVHYMSAIGPSIIPLYEDRPVDVTLGYQILATGGKRVDSFDHADILLIMNTPGGAMKEASAYPDSGIEYSAFRNFHETFDLLKDALSKGLSPVIGDIAYANGGDFEILRFLKANDLLYSIGGYAGWNTSSNTLGTAIPQGMIHNIYGNSQKHKDFLALRYIEDIGYCSFVRKEVSELLPAKNLSYTTLDGVNGEVSVMIQEKLQSFSDTHLKTDTYHPIILESYQPWNRMFEVGLKVKVNT